MSQADDLVPLKKIGLLGGINSSVAISSLKLAEELGTSKQTASRRLISLENEGLITRSSRTDGQYIMITESGENLLRKEYADYKSIFEREKGYFRFEGKVVSGLGEGRYYVSIPEYLVQFKEKLGFEPYPGTLNLKLDPAGIEARRKLDNLRWTEITGFTSNDRTFGSAGCLKCSIGGYMCAIIVPGRSHYPEDTVEIISEVRLRDKEGLKDGDIITVEVEYNDR
ncbi:DUF120 domain-containing protein [Methanoplanus limicola]|uniref:Riboflavin kinase n=1 Tax=Methanoplanus limicola DSM 2279 TaxID=937775 RepID=H1YXM6_9EURY|nr:DUF120 domain-containing protein [Methanoplanus limicola]EHQ34995.1 CTP-dependent riboflavin kinase [Methanoplanus limicola DSM 2279]